MGCGGRHMNLPLVACMCFKTLELSSFAFTIIIVTLCFIMAIKFVWAVATWWQGRLYIYGGRFYGTKAGAEDAYEELGQSLDTRVLAGKCFLYMHAVRR